MEQEKENHITITYKIHLPQANEIIQVETSTKHKKKYTKINSIFHVQFGSISTISISLIISASGKGDEDNDRSGDNGGNVFFPFLLVFFLPKLRSIFLIR